MAVQIQSRRSSTAHDRPFPIRLGAGELAVNNNSVNEIKDATRKLESTCEFYVERRMNNSIKSLIAGKDINDII